MPDRSGALPLLAATARVLRGLVDEDGAARFGAVGTFLLNEQTVARAPGALAVVLPLRDAAGENRTPTAGAVQRLASTVVVAIGVRVWNDAAGESAIDPLTSLLDATRSALVGWTPPATPTRRSGPFRLVRGELYPPAPPIVWWQDQFETEAWIGDSVETIGG